MSIERARSLRQRMPPSEAALWNALRALKPTGLHFRRQVPLGRYYADFACHHPRLVIEVDGWTHDDPAYDAERDRFMQGEGYRVLRVSSVDVLRNLDGVIRAVLTLCGLENEQTASAPHLSLPAWGGRRAWERSDLASRGGGSRCEGR